jgi:hypothetical protein
MSILPRTYEQDLFKRSSSAFQGNRVLLNRFEVSMKSKLPDYDNLKLADLELISEPKYTITHICWGCMKLKTILTGSESLTIYSLWDCCEDSYAQPVDK